LRDQELAARLGRAARTLVEKQFTWKTAASQFERIIENTVCGSSKPAVARKTA